MYDFLVVGAGMFGCTFAERAKASGKKVLVIDQRDHIGGNCFTREIDGINVHWYGAHIFHTNEKSIWEYVNRFAEFNNFTNRVKAFFNGRFYQLPINLFTMNQLWGVVTPQEAADYLNTVKIDIKHPENMEEWYLANFGQEIYEMFFKGYTIKQWRRHPSELPASIAKRVPLRLNHDNNYFTDAYQGVPIGGYTNMFHRMLDGVEVKLNTWLENDWQRYAKTLVYSGRPDVLLDMKYGELEYTTLSFEHFTSDGDYQGNAVINYTSKDIPYTRIIEHKHFEFKTTNKTVVTREYPIDWTKDSTPYYVIPGADEVYRKYEQEIKSKGIIIGGRLGRHQYMDQVIANALHEFGKIVR